MALCYLLFLPKYYFWTCLSIVKVETAFKKSAILAKKQNSVSLNAINETIL